MRRSHWALGLALSTLTVSASAAPKKKGKAPPPAVETKVEAAPAPPPEPPPPAPPPVPEPPPAPAPAAREEEKPPAPAATKSAWTLELRLPVGRYERRRLGTSDGGDQLKTNVDIGPIAAPAIRLWTPLAEWVALGGELSGGFSSEDLDSGTTQKTSVLVGLEAQLRITPWHLSWGYPQLTLGVGGLFFDGRYIETNASSGTLTALLPKGTGELGALIWLVPGSIGLDFAGSAGYAFGPGQLHVGDGQEVFLQRFTIELGAGLAATF